MGAQARHMLHPLNAETDGLFIALMRRVDGGDGA
jgi:hypothetical protein